jgi:thiol-disulfide isomerase/thioredoxin
MTAKEIEGEDIDGKKFKLSDYRGKVVLLDFWGEWCVWCRRMYPDNRELTSRMQGKAFTIVGVNSDGDRKLVKDVLAREKITWPTFFDGGQRGPIDQGWQIQGWPAMILIDAKGVVRQKFMGKQELATLENAINALLKEAGG